MPKHSFTNIAAGMRGLNLKGGETVYVEPGQTLRDVELDDAELKATKDAGYFVIDQRAADADKPVDLKGLDEAQLRSIGEAEGVNFGDKTKAADLRSLIEVHRAAKAESQGS